MAKLSKDDWLKQGLILLVKEGVDAVTIDGMCRQLEVTKGSFYHHFKNRDAFLEGLLTYWENTYTTQFIEFSLKGKTPLARIQRLNALVTQAHGTEENIIRAWAQTSPLAREFQERVDQRRMGFLAQLQFELHGDEALAQRTAQLIYATLIGAQQMMPPATQHELAAMFAMLEKIMITGSQQER